MKDRVYEAIKLQHGKIAFKNLHKKFDIDEDGLKKILLELKKEGKIIQKGNKYDLFPEDNYIGTICIGSHGKRFVFHDKERVSVSTEHGKDVLLHDVVSYKINDKNEAEVTSIIDRTLGRMTCEVEVIDGKKRIVPYHEGIEIILHDNDMDNLLDGDIILVDLTSSSLDDFCDAKYIETIAHRDDPNKLELMTALNYGFDNFYSDEFIEEVMSLPTSVSEGETIDRYDFREQDSFTIDGFNTKDMDDGVFAERISNNLIRVYVHIADVSHYVKPGMHLFERACDKTTSAYINDSVFHMLHHTVSNGICSLNPYVDRLAKTVIMDINENGDIVNFNIVKSVINSKKKMDYDSVDEILYGYNIPAGYERFVDTLQLLYEASLRLEHKYLDDGKIEFANTESDNTYNSDGSIKEFRDLEEGPGRKLIENLMIAANKTVATWIYWSNVPSVYRIHEMPKIEKVNEAIKKMNQSGYKIRYINNADSPKIIQSLFEKIKKNEEFPVLSEILIQFMQRARYSTENIGHYALALDAYTHFTSPIRRLSDLLVHMITDLILIDYELIDSMDFKKVEKDLSYLCERASKMERQADMAEKDAELTVTIDKMDRMTRNGNDEFIARVVDIDKTIKVRINNVDCIIKEDDLASNFIFDKGKRLYYDSDTGKYIKLGAKILVKIRSINVTSRIIRVSVLSVPTDDRIERMDTYGKVRTLTR